MRSQPTRSACSARSAGGELPLQDGSQDLPAPGLRVPYEIPNHVASHLYRDLQFPEHSHPPQLIYINTTEEDIIPFICTALFPFTEYSHIYYL